MNLVSRRLFGSLLYFKERPRRSGAPLPLVVPCFLARTSPLLCPAIHAAQHERAGRARVPSAAGSTAGRTMQETASGTGHLTRSRPQDSASTAAAPQWEPRKPLGGTTKPRRGTPAGLKWIKGLNRGLARPGPPTSFNPSDQSRKRILHKKGPAGAGLVFPTSQCLRLSPQGSLRSYFLKGNFDAPEALAGL